MFIFKYSFINIHKNLKLYVPLFFITTLTLFALICVFTVRNNVLSAQEEQFGEYAVVAISPKNVTSVLITDEWIEHYSMTEFTNDFYGFSEFWAGSETLTPMPTSVYEPWGILFNVPFEGTMPYTLIAYSDISKSPHFKFEDRRIIDGRFALNTDECNISTELAELNGLSVGDSIEIYLYYHNPAFIDFEIVGIYVDNTKNISSELPLVTPRIIAKSVYENTYSVRTSRVSQENISRNQILTAVPSSYDLKSFSLYSTTSGYGAAVYYTHDEKSIPAYIEAINNILPDELMIYDSADMMRYVHHVLDKTAKSFDWILVIAYLISVIFSALIIFYILKERTYDISVFRARGMSRIKTAFLLSSEVFVVLTLAFAAAGVLYYTTYTSVAEFMYYMQDIFVSNDSSFWLDFSPEIMNAARAYEFVASVNQEELIYGFVAAIIHTIIVGITASLFISRHEPMKTMTRI